MKSSKPRTIDFQLTDDLSGAGAGTPPNRDTLAYMADLLLELKQMADRSGHGTLSGLLRLAHNEALIQAAGTVSRT